MTTHRAQQDLGHPVKAPGTPLARLLWLSASTLTKADPTQVGGCLRRWHYHYIAGREEPQTEQQEVGVRGHAEIEHYLKTGEKLFSDVVLAGSHFIPQFDPESHLVECPIGELSDGTHLMAAGVPLYGHSDLVNLSREYISSPGNKKHDLGTVEICDWKFTSDVHKWVKTGPQLAETIQMVTYGYWASLRFASPHVRLSHVYFQTGRKRDARKVTILVTQEELAERWKRIEEVARTMIDAARVANSSEVPGNRSACGAYRGCPHRAYCEIGNQDALTALFGDEAMNLKQKLSKDAQSELDLLFAEEAAVAEPVATPALAGILPPDAPESDPSLAAKPLDPEPVVEEKPAKKPRRPKGMLSGVIENVDLVRDGAKIEVSFPDMTYRERAFKILLQIAEDTELYPCDRIAAAQALLYAVVD